MAPSKVVAGLALVVTAIWAGATAQSDCTNALISMSPCLNYIQGNTSTPSSSCCTQLASVVRSSPQCLCQVLDGGSSSLGIDVNQTQALALPGQCNVETPPASKCNATSPAASPSGTPESPATPSGTSSKTTPSADTNNTSSGSSIKLSISSSFILFAAIYGSAYAAY